MPATDNQTCRSRHTLIRSLICTAAIGLAYVASSPGIADEDKPVNPATVAEAAQRIDLATFPLLDEIENPSVRSLTQLVYRTKGTIKNVFDFQKAKLAALKFEELADSQISDQEASATFVRDDFLVSVTVSVASSPITRLPKSMISVPCGGPESSSGAYRHGP